MILKKLSLVLAVSVLTAGAQAQAPVPLQLELPKPLFAGTPRPILSHLLDIPRGTLSATGGNGPIWTDQHRQP